MDHTISLATADRRRSLVFYRDGLGLEPFGPLADDGVPEPLQLRLASSVSLMLIPTGGFGWVAGKDPWRHQAPTSACWPSTPLTRRPYRPATRPPSPPAKQRLRALTAGVERLRSPGRRP